MAMHNLEPMGFSSMEFQGVLPVVVVVIAILLTWGLMMIWRRLPVKETGEVPVMVLGTKSTVLTWLKYRFMAWPKLAAIWQMPGRWTLPKLDLTWLRRKPTSGSSTDESAIRAIVLDRAQIKAGLLVLVELSLIVVWALWVGRFYLDFNPQALVSGGDSPNNVQSYFALSTFKDCGACVLWNGGYNGGSPTLVDALIPAAHPLALVLIMLFGIVNGVKCIAVASLASAGLAQWWLAKVLGWGRVPRLWSAALVVVGGHLAGRMQNGLVEIIFSVAACSLVIPPALDLALTGRRRSAVVFGVFLGLALLSGQAYMQLTLALAIFPAFLIWLVDERWRLRPVWKEFVLAGGLALLVASILLVPFLHFSPNFTKPSATEEFISAQPLSFAPLNLVINDYAFYSSTALKPLDWPFEYVNYIGWIPVFLAILAFCQAPRSARRLLVFLLSSIVLVYLMSSGVTLRALTKIMPSAVNEWLLHFPNLSPISSLAVPYVLALAAWGVDNVVKTPALRLRLPLRRKIGLGKDNVMKTPALRLRLALRGEVGLTFNCAWLILPLPLLFAIYSAYDFGHVWLTTNVLPADYGQIVPGLKPSNSAWVSPPPSDWGFAATAQALGFKLTDLYRPWTWKDHSDPPPSILASRDPIDPATPGFREKIQYLSVIDHPEVYYAAVVTPNQTTPCQATAEGGNIDVDCEAVAGGQLVVYENYWSGWAVRRDGAPAGLLQSQWLTTAAPAGRHHYEFRYRPWDVVVGLALTLTGWCLAFWLWWRAPIRPSSAVAMK